MADLARQFISEQQGSMDFESEAQPLVAKVFEDESFYSHYRYYNHPLYGRISILRDTRETGLIMCIEFRTERREEALEAVELARARGQLNHHNLLFFYDYSLQIERSFCSTKYLVSSYFDFPSTNLGQDFKERQSRQDYYTLEELSLLTVNVLESLRHIHAFRLHHGNVCLKTVQHRKANRSFVLLDHFGEKRTLRQFYAEKNILDEPGFLAPELHQALASDLDPQSDHNLDLRLCDLFSLGMVVLTVGLLQSTNDCYASDGQFDWLTVEQYIKAFQERNKLKGGPLLQAVQILFAKKPQDRLRVMSLLDELKALIHQTRREASQTRSGELSVVPNMRSIETMQAADNSAELPKVVSFENVHQYQSALARSVQPETRETDAQLKVESKTELAAEVPRPVNVDLVKAYATLVQDPVLVNVSAEEFFGDFPLPSRSPTRNSPKSYLNTQLGRPMAPQLISTKEEPFFPQSEFLFSKTPVNRPAMSHALVLTPPPLSVTPYPLDLNNHSRLHKQPIIPPTKTLAHYPSSAETLRLYSNHPEPRRPEPFDLRRPTLHQLNMKSHLKSSSVTNPLLYPHQQSLSPSRHFDEYRQRVDLAPSSLKLQPVPSREQQNPSLQAFSRRYSKDGGLAQSLVQIVQSVERTEQPSRQLYRSQANPQVLINQSQRQLAPVVSLPYRGMKNVPKTLRLPHLPALKSSFDQKAFINRKQSAVYSNEEPFKQSFEVDRRSFIESRQGQGDISRLLVSNAQLPRHKLLIGEEKKTFTALKGYKSPAFQSSTKQGEENHRIHNIPSIPQIATSRPFLQSEEVNLDKLNAERAHIIETQREVESKVQDGLRYRRMGHPRSIHTVAVNGASNYFSEQNVVRSNN